MSDTAALAARLRSAVQGCTVHIHGPVQALEQAWSEAADPYAVLVEVQRLCLHRIDELLAEGVPVNDPSIRKEERTSWFCGLILRGAPE